MRKNRIAQLRAKQHLTQELLAEKLDISRASLSHYETGKREPDLETLTKMADFFHVSVDYLVGRTNHPEKTLDQDVRNFMDSLELSDQRILDSFTLTIDGKPLTAEEAQRFIAFVRANRK